jgi:hypothetical protein
MFSGTLTEIVKKNSKLDVAYSLKQLLLRVKIPVTFLTLNTKYTDHMVHQHSTIKQAV